MAEFLSKLRAPAGSNASPRRKGRGVGSGLGKTAGKGQKGQKARNPGNFGKPGFQGGQTPIQRRLPKRGFNSPFPTEWAIVNVGLLAKRFAAGAVVDLAALKQVGLVERKAVRVKLLGDGDVGHALTVRVDAVSGSARAKLEKAGGKIELPAAPKQEQ